MQKGESGYKEHLTRLHGQLSVWFAKRFKGMSGAVVFDRDGNKACNMIYPKQWKQKLWKGPIGSVSNSIFQPVEVVQPEGRTVTYTPSLMPSCVPPTTHEMELPQGSTWRLNALFQQAPRGPIVHSSLSGIPCHCNLHPITFSRDSFICVDPEWTYGYTKRTPRGLPQHGLLHFLFYSSQKEVWAHHASIQDLKHSRTKYQHSTVSLRCAREPPDLICQFKHVFFFTCNLHHFSVAQYWMWVLAGSISAKHYLSQWKPALWWNLLQEDNFCLLKRDPPCRHCAPWPPVKGQVCLAFPWYRFSRQGMIRPISSPTCPGLYQW